MTSNNTTNGAKTMTRTQQIASTILQQIDGMADGGSLLATITKRDFVALEINDEHNGGVQFSFKNAKRGQLSKVVIKLTYADDYIIEVWQFDRKTLVGTKLDEWDRQYCDQLAERMLDAYELCGGKVHA